MQDAELLAKRPSNNEQRFDQRRQPGKFSTSSLMRASNLTVPTIPTLRPKLRKVPRKSLSMAIAFDCSNLRWVVSLRRGPPCLLRSFDEDIGV